MTDTPIRTAQEALDAGERYEGRACKDVPADCVDFAVVDLSIGKEVCRVWDEEDCRLIAELLNARIQPTTLPDPEAIALPTEGELVALIERTLDVHDDWNIPPSHSVARAILALMKGEG